MADSRKYNLRYMDQISYLAGLHRSGWPLVMRTLLQLHDSNAPTLLDTYVDRTFHWLKPSFFPYDKPWVGFVHHTWNTEFSPYNNVNLLKNPLFLSSLDHCRGLYVFSRTQAQRWRTELQTLKLDIPVQEFVHPTQVTNIPLWTPEKFMQNQKKRIVQIGAWLRDNYSIFRLNDFQRSVTISKANGPNYSLTKSALKGPQMDHYFRPDNFFRLLRPPQYKDYVAPIPILSAPFSTPTGPIDDVSVNGYMRPDIIAPSDTETQDSMCRDVMCRDSDMYLNKYVLGAIKLLQEVDASVVVLPSLNNADYDILLSENIVYLPLVDAAAVNTLMECIARNTPVLVSKLDAVREVLGEDYPLYIQEDHHVDTYLSDSAIMAAYGYLQAMDKTSLTTSYFLTSLVNGSIYQSL